MISSSFAFSVLEPLHAGAAETDLYVFSDAAKKDADKGKVQEIRDYVKSVQGFRQVELRSARKQNYGLAKKM